MPSLGREGTVNLLASILGSMVGKATDPLFLAVAATAIVFAWRGWWAASFAAYAIGIAVNIAMVWSWWRLVGIADPIEQAIWLTFIWLLWWVVLTGIVYAITRFRQPIPV